MGSYESAKFSEVSELGVEMEAHEPIMWKCHTLLEKFDDEGNFIEKKEVEGNLLVTTGALCLFEYLRGDAGDKFNAANSYIGVGDSNTAAAIGQTNLQAATNKFRAAMVEDWPKVGTGDGLATNNLMQFKASFATGEANFAWQEWGIFNHASAGDMLNRKVENLGTKVSGIWTLTVTVSLA